MLTLDKELKDFFENNIFNDEDEVNDFLAQYDYESIVKGLFEELKSLVELLPDLANLVDLASRLGSTFARISKKYSIDQKIYSFLDNCNTYEKVALFNFLIGYWYNTESHLDTVSGLSNTLLDMIPDKCEWSDESMIFMFGVDALANGYFSYYQEYTINDDIGSILKERLKLFSVHLSNLSQSKFSSQIDELVDFIQSLS